MTASHGQGRFERSGASDADGSGHSLDTRDQAQGLFRGQPENHLSEMQPDTAEEIGPMFEREDRP